MDHTGQTGNWTGDQGGPQTSQNADVIGSRLDVEELDGLWTGHWIRRPGTNIFDADWTSAQYPPVHDVVRLAQVSGDQVTFTRDGNGGTYTGTIGPDGHTIRGTASWYSPGMTWSATFDGVTGAPSGHDNGANQNNGWRQNGGPGPDDGGPANNGQDQNGSQGSDNGQHQNNGEDHHGDHARNGPSSHDERTLFDNWNTAGCGVTDTAALDLDRPTHLTRVDLWFRWNADESSVGYTVTSGGEQVRGGTLQRAECDPYQGAWCVARDTPDADLSPGHYEFRVEREGVCQNGGSGGAGFIKAYGYDQ